MSGKTKILLIDDEPLVREELGGLLQDEGYEVITADDGEEGLARFRSAEPDMVITDVRMPRKDGLSVAATIRRHDPRIPVAVITGHGSEGMAIEALRSGVIDFIKKPVRLEDLIITLGRLEAARRPLAPRFAEMPPAVQLLSRTWVYQLGNDLEQIPPFVDALLDRCTAGIEHVAVLELSLALRELVLNAVEHGNLGLSYQEKSAALEAGRFEQLLEERARSSDFGGRRVTVSVRRETERLVFTIEDEGTGFDWRALPDPADAPDLLSAHGRGVLLSRMSVDRLEFNDRGNRVTVEKRF